MLYYFWEWQETTQTNIKEFKNQEEVSPGTLKQINYKSTQETNIYEKDNVFLYEN